MRTTTASEIADYLAYHIVPVYGVIGRAQAERALFCHYGFLAREVVAQAIIIAECRGQTVREHGGTTLRRVK